MNVPVIDLFAGPGGLGEGFSKAKRAQFEIAVSIEKDPKAHETLRLRAAHRYLSRHVGVDSLVWKAWDDIIASTPWAKTFEALKSSAVKEIAAACASASAEAWNLEMGPANRDEVIQGIRHRLARLGVHGRRARDAVLIGGPPCQAYSVVGRSRNRGKEGYVPEEDHRHFLYREYLNVIAEFEPAVFVMENVKGILTSRVSDRQIFDSIQFDLRNPAMAVGRHRVGAAQYVLQALPETSNGGFFPEPSDFIVRAEEFGVPQARHRVIICGVRKDIYERSGGLRGLEPAPAPCVRDVLNNLPPLRAQLSHRGKGLKWEDSFKTDLLDSALRELDQMPGKAAQVAARMRALRATFLAGMGVSSTGADRTHLMRASESTAALSDWYWDRGCSVLANHESRGHMPPDLVRYLFLSAWGEAHDRSPKLKHFPPCLLPDHENVKDVSLDEAPFRDRFRVQVGALHSMTVTSHISKDGHAFIHPDPEQCRSLTVREAARLQTFPDSYVFLGCRTSQYTQVGNAVPPYLALQIAEQVADVIARAG